MTVGPSPVGVQGRGVPARLALSAFLLGLAAVVGIGFLGEKPEAPPREGDVGQPPTATAGWTSAPSWPPIASPSPLVACATPRIDPLVDPVARHPRGLVPTGIVTLGRFAGGVDTLVADRDGSLWGMGGGRLLRFDQRGKLVAAWTFADDATFGMSSLAPARDGGIWLSGERDIRWFDGHRFRDVVPAPASYVQVAEGPDGSLWAAGWRTGLLHWDGRSWTRVCGSPADTDVSGVAVEADGDVWVAFSATDGGTSSDPARYDGRRWITYPGGVSASNANLVVGPDGSVWALAGGGLLRFDGTSWSRVEGGSGLLSGGSPLAVGPDGSLWALGDPGALGEPGAPRDATSGTSVLRYDGTRWSAFRHADGLPEVSGSQNAVSGLAVAGSVPFAATTDGLFRLEGGRWARTWNPGGPSGPTWITSILPVSRDTAWVIGASPIGDFGLWRVGRGGWTPMRIADWSSSPPDPGYGPPQPVAAYRAGVLAVGGDRGLVVLRDGRWTTLAKGSFQAVAVADDGRRVYAVGSAGGVALGSVESRVAATFTLTDSGWKRADVEISSPAGRPLVVDRAGTWWLTTECGWSPCSLLAIRGGHVTEVKLTDMGIAAGPDGDWMVATVEAAPNGDVWALLLKNAPTPEVPPSIATARYRGGAWRVFEAADGLVSAWSSRIAIAPDGTVWVAGDGLWRQDGTSWTLVRRSGFSDIAFAPDGSAWVVEPSGVAVVPADLLEVTRLSDAAAGWCSAFGNWAAVHAAALELGIDEAAIDARAAAVVAARGRAQDPVAFAQARRQDGEYARACGAAFASRG